MTEEIISLRINSELKERMNSFNEVNWSAVIRNLIEKRVKELSKIEKMRKQLETKEEKELIKWSVELGRKAKENSFRKLFSELSKEKREELLDRLSPENRKKLQEL